MIAIGSKGLLKIVAAVLVLSLAIVRPLPALEMADMIVDSISAHPEVKEKIHIYRQVVSDRAIADSGWRPSVDLQASSGYFDTESPQTNGQSVDYDSTVLEMSVTQNLFNGYDTTHQIQQTQARAQAALYDIYDTADNVALRAIQAYLEVIKQQQLYQLAFENVTAHEEILAQIRDRNLSGVGRRSQLQQTEGRLARAHASLIAQDNNLEDAATELHQILGRYVDPQALNEPSIPAMPEEDLNLLLDQALANHPAMRVAAANIEAAQANQRRSLRTRYPNIDLELATEYGDDIGGLEGNTEETRLVLNLTYNLYRGGAKGAEQQKGISEIYEQKEFAARVRRQIINTLRLSWTADTSLTRQLEYLDTHVLKASQTVESYTEEFFIGQRDLIDLLDAENERNSAQNRQTEAKFDGLAARYRVYEGLGMLLQNTSVVLEIEDGNLQVARLYADQIDRLPLPTDEDEDNELDQSDHCDNSQVGIEVNPYGCRQSVVVTKLEPRPAAEPKQPSTSATPSITAAASILNDDVFEVATNSLLVITPAQLLANDIDDGIGPLEIISLGQPVAGRLAFDPATSIIYRPTEGFVGEDQFHYAVANPDSATGTTMAMVKIRVHEPKPVNLSKTHKVNFVYDEARLTNVSEAKVNAIIDQIKRTEGIKIEIYTHTDNIGSDAYNFDLSSRRAESLRKLLIDNGVPPDDITAMGKGEDNPIGDNATETGKAINRRGEFVFKIKEPIQLESMENEALPAEPMENELLPNEPMENELLLKESLQIESSQYQLLPKQASENELLLDNSLQSEAPQTQLLPNHSLENGLLLKDTLQDEPLQNESLPNDLSSQQIELPQIEPLQLESLLYEPLLNVSPPNDSLQNKPQQIKPLENKPLRLESLLYEPMLNASLRDELRQ